MKSVDRIALVSFCVLVAIGCAKPQITSREVYGGEKLARPDRIIVHDFAATPTDIPAWSEAARQYAGAAGGQSPEEIATGRRLGTQVANELVEDIGAMGLTAVTAAGQPPPREGDIVLIGYFEGVEEGSAGRRLVVGFGSGSADLKTHVEGYLQTGEGLRKLGSGSMDSGGGKSPGVAVPLVVAVVTANPVSLVVGGAVKAYGEVSGKSAIEGAAERTAELISNELRGAFRRQGWI